MAEEQKKANKQKKKKQGFLGPRKRITLVQRLFFVQQLEIMVRTGFSLAKALETINLQVEHEGFRKTIQEMREDVEKGTPLSKAAGKHPKTFSETFVSMLEAGEASGKLDEVLRRLSIQLKKSHELRAKVKNALTYPAIVTIAMVAIGIAMVIFVLPNITSLYTDAQADLPLPTRVLIGLTDFMSAYLIYVIIAVALAIFLLARYLKTVKGKRQYHALLLKIPIVSPIIKKVNLANFTRSLSSLLKTDIPIVETFLIISRASKNVIYKEYLKQSAEELKKGISVRETLEKNPDLFPPLITQIINIGEESGTLDTTSEDMANFYEEEVSNTMENLAAVIEPVLMLVIGVAVGAVALAVIMPIYSLVGQI
ncbi:type II secretion system F family protein [Patescibacteria group bacterium]|nr:type II secretion system F family protein [Patescibacteria group bacterium]